MNDIQLYNVYATNIETGEKTLMAENKTEDNAEAIIRMCIMRRGVDEEFYSTEEVKK